MIWAMAHKCSTVEHSTEELKQKQKKWNSEFQRKCAEMEIGVMQFTTIVLKRKHLQ